MTRNGGLEVDIDAVFPLVLDIPPHPEQVSVLHVEIDIGRRGKTGADQLHLPGAAKGQGEDRLLLGEEFPIRVGSDRVLTVPVVVEETKVGVNSKLGLEQTLHLLDFRRPRVDVHRHTAEPVVRAWVATGPQQPVLLRPKG